MLAATAVRMGAHRGAERFGLGENPKTLPRIEGPRLVRVHREVVDPCCGLTNS